MLISSTLTPKPPQPQAADGQPHAEFLPIILMFGVLYFLMIRPQMKKAKEHTRHGRRARQGR